MTITDTIGFFIDLFYLITRLYYHIFKLNLQAIAFSAHQEAALIIALRSPNADK